MVPNPYFSPTVISSYRDLIVWQRGMSLVSEIYRLSGTFPTSERFGLVGQVRRSAVSVVANIAEGHGRPSRSEYRRFLAIASGSLRETSCYLDVAQDLGYLGAPDVVTARGLCDEVGRMLRVLMRRL